MGKNTFVSCEEFCIRIDLENSSYFTGEEVSGAIYLYINTPLTPGPLSIKFAGREQNYLYCAPSSHLDNSLKAEGSKIIQKKKIIEKLCIRKSVYMVCEWTKPVRAGAYRIPFRLLLPLDLPGSFSFKKGQINSSIAYSIKAQIPHKRVIVYEKCPIIILQEPGSAPGKLLEDPLTEFFGCCRKSKGKCKVSLKLDSEPIQINKKSRIFLEIDNSQSAVFIKNIEISLYYVVSLINYVGESVDETENVFTSYFKVVIRPGETRTGPKALEIEVNFETHKKRLSKFPMVSGQNVSSCYILKAKPRGSGIFDCLIRHPQDASYIRISPVKEIKKIWSFKQLDCEFLNFNTVELKEYNGQVLETDI